MTDVLGIVVMVAFYAAAIPAVVLPVLYGFRSQWRSTPSGRRLFTLFAALGLIFLATVAYRLWPWLPGLRLAAAVLYSSLAFALWRMVWQLWRVQQQDRRDNNDEES